MEQPKIGDKLIKREYGEIKEQSLIIDISPRFIVAGNCKRFENKKSFTTNVISACLDGRSRFREWGWTFEN